MQIYVGTSGFQYAHWNNGVFYPRGVKDRLAYALDRFDAIEINSTFYSIPRPETVAAWAAGLSGKSKLVLKAPQSVSHRRRLKLQSDPGIKQGLDLLNYFIDGCLTIPAANRGPVLIQLPGSMAINLPRLEPVLQVFAERDLRVALEIRHASWFDNGTFALLEKYGAALVASDWTEFKTPLVLTSDFLYIRRHGPGSMYSSAYDDDALRSDVTQLLDQPVREAYVFFNNDIHGYAPKNAMRMIELIEEQARPIQVAANFRIGNPGVGLPPSAAGFAVEGD
ncbi:MAG: hypothetical protein JWQ23_4428 [Herminiimonas sp.]|nr:hypothetical protein [Herminiimonas sp.]